MIKLCYCKANCSSLMILKCKFLFNHYYLIYNNCIIMKWKQLKTTSRFRFPCLSRVYKMYKKINTFKQFFLLARTECVLDLSGLLCIGTEWSTTSESPRSDRFRKFRSGSEPSGNVWSRIFEIRKRRRVCLGFKLSLIDFETPQEISSFLFFSFSSLVLIHLMCSSAACFCKPGTILFFLK